MTNSSTRPYRIVVGMDLEPSGDTALMEAVRLGSHVAGCELHPVYAIDADPAVALKAIEEMSNHLTRAMERLRERVERIVDGLGVGQRVRLHVRFGDPVRVLQQVAVDYDGDLLIVGTHARKGIERLLLGSVASDLAKVARLPLLIARPKDFSGLAPTPQPDPERPGVSLHSGDQIVSEVMLMGPRTPHISGLL